MEGAQNIIATSVVSVKTTTTKDVFAWLRQSAVDKNIINLREGGSGILWAKKTIKYIDVTPEIHICMPKENITQSLRDTWFIELNKKQGVKFEIFAIVEYMKL